MPAAELGGPSTIVKELLRTEGRGRLWSIRLDWTSLYTEETRPVTGARFDLTAASPLEMKEIDIVTRASTITRETDGGERLRDYDTLTLRVKRLKYRELSGLAIPIPN